MDSELNCIGPLFEPPPDLDPIDPRAPVRRLASRVVEQHAELERTVTMEPQSVARFTQQSGSSSNLAKPPTHSTIEKGHGRHLSSDSFGGFVDSTDAPAADGPRGTAGDDEWQDADLMASFSPESPSQRQLNFPASKQQQQSQQPPLGELDWTAWEAQLDSQSSQATTSANGNDDFISAYEKMNVNPLDRVPSPPIIDLREMSKKLDQQKALRASGLQADDLLFFETFENDPRKVMANSRQQSHNHENRLDSDQLSSIQEAQASPLRIQQHSAQHSEDYFGETDPKGRRSGSPDLVSPQGAEASGSSLRRPSPSEGRAGSWTEAAGSWAGSLRKTIGSIRGHLPSARDFYVPEDELDGSQDSPRDQSPNRSRPPRLASMFQEDPTADNATEKRTQSASSDRRAVHSRKLADIANYSQSTPFSNHSDAASPPTSLKPLAPGTLPHTSTGHHSGAPISGAPGFNPNSGRNWNTGSWSMTSQDELARRNKPIPVTLKGRRDETQEVVDDEMAAALTARLPKRHQLGKTWKLLYSSDQDGVSLGTLYWKVANGLDARNGAAGGRVSGGGVADAEGWMRGASQAAKAAMIGNGANGGVQRVGGGLSLSEAGLMLAIKDDDEHVFGAFVNEKLRPQTTYYGNGECFLWKQTEAGQLKTFPWTGKNDYMILTEAHYLSFGGGAGKYGLWLDGQLEQGVSSACPAFDNEILCNGRDDGAQAATIANTSSYESSPEGRFECITLEVWACGID